MNAYNPLYHFPLSVPLVRVPRMELRSRFTSKSNDGGIRQNKGHTFGNKISELDFLSDTLEERYRVSRS